MVQNGSSRLELFLASYSFDEYGVMCDELWISVLVDAV